MKIDTPQIKWEYATVTFLSGEDYVYKLNEVGNEGWECCGISNTKINGVAVSVAILKRPKKRK